MYKLNLEIPESFFKGEERCGYFVSPEMKKVWAVLLDILNEVSRICEKHNIKWFADGGTLLGAARHGGFIPWDDDVDVRMLRPDYDKFIEVAQQELNYPYFLQTEQSDPGSLRCHAQIRNCETTGILKGEVKCLYSFNQGIFLDIFPWDNIHDDDSLVIQQVEDMRCVINRLKYRRYFPYIYWKTKRRNVIAWLYNSVKAWWIRNITLLPNDWDAEFDEIYTIITRYQSVPTKKVGNLSLLKFEKNWHNLREYYDEVSYLPFEMLSIPVPTQYDNALTIQYGDWRKPSQVPSCHGGVIFDTERSYKDVLREMKKEGVNNWMKRNGVY